jgi:hypothetical protein
MKVPWTEDDDTVRLRQQIDELRSRLTALEARLDPRVDRGEDGIDRRRDEQGLCRRGRT